MRIKALVSLTLLFCLSAVVPAFAAAPGNVTVELKDLVGRISDKVNAGQTTDQALAGELKEFDAILAEHQAEKTEEVAQVYIMEARLYVEVLNNPEKGIAVLRALQSGLPDTPIGQKAGAIISRIQNGMAVQKLQQSLVPGAVFPDFAERDTAGQPLSIASRKGKVILIDFWATWCPPCRDEIPNVVKVYQKYHAQGLDIIGISLDKQGDGEKLAAFTKENSMTWPQYFDGGYWQNKLVQKYGITGIPATYLVDPKGQIIAKDVRGDELDAAVAKALGAK